MTLVVFKKLFLSLFPRRTSEDLRRIYRGIFNKGTRIAEPIFLLGVGAQKSGTSWLHDYLKSHPSADMGFEKEYHVFNRLYIADQQKYDEFLQKKLDDMYDGGKPVYWEDRLRVDLTLDLRKYFNYFKFRVGIGKSIYLTGDITPEYSALGPGVYSLIKNNLIQRGMRPRVIFLMRDPVERCISASRMYLKGTGVERTEASENAKVEAHYHTASAESRGRYDRTIKNLETVFSPDEILYVFYEELFNDSSMRRITEFLDIEYVEPDFRKMVNVARTDNPIHDELRRRVYDHYRDVYDFVAERFGEEKVSSIWKSRRDYRSN